MVRRGAWNEDVRLAKACHVSFPTSQRGDLWRLGAVPRLLYTIIMIAFETKAYGNRKDTVTTIATLIVHQ